MPQAPVAGRANRSEVVSQQPLVDAERILRDFTRRAFRRPVTQEDIKPFLARVEAQLEKNDTFEQALREETPGVLKALRRVFPEATLGADDLVADVRT